MGGVVPSDPASLLEIELGSYPFARIRGELSAGAWEQLMNAGEDARALLGGHTLWSINSTARGGGIAEMQRTLWPYWRDAGLDARWLVLRGTPAFFRLTKRLHNLLHGSAVAHPAISDHELFARVGRAGAAYAVDLVSPGDVVILQDPQTAALVAPLKRAGAVVVWRCHVGADGPNDAVEAAWHFLLPYVEEADAFIFTRRAFVPPTLDPRRVGLLTPAIDPCSYKNRGLEAGRGRAILERAGSPASPARWWSRSPAGIASRIRSGSSKPSRCTSRIRERHWSSRVPRSTRWRTTRRPVGSSLTPGQRGTGCRPPGGIASGSRRCRWTTSRRMPCSSTRSSARRP